jgi:hypothetical protein
MERFRGRDHPWSDAFFPSALAGVEEGGCGGGMRAGEWWWWCAGLGGSAGREKRAAPDGERGGAGLDAKGLV